jgi:hypothetical protein
MEAEPSSRPADQTERAQPLYPRPLGVVVASEPWVASPVVVALVQGAWMSVPNLLEATEGAQQEVEYSGQMVSVGKMVLEGGEHFRVLLSALRVRSSLSLHPATVP